MTVLFPVYLTCSFAHRRFVQFLASLPSNTRIRILVNVVCSNRVVSLTVDNNISVSDLFLSFPEIFRPSLLLSFNGSFLSPDDILCSVSVTSNATLTLVSSLSGGSKADQKLVESGSDDEVDPPIPLQLTANKSKAMPTCPYFLDDNNSAALWFVVMESTFPVHGIISSRDKFNHILSQIPTNVISKMSSAIKIAADEKFATPYEILKEALTQQFMPDKAFLFHKYFKSLTIGDLPPTKFLEKCIIDLDTLQPGLSKDDALLRRFFLSSLPQTTQQILTVLPSTVSLKDLATAADRMAEVAGLSHQTNIHSITQIPALPSTSSNASTSLSVSGESALCHAITLLTDKIMNLDSRLNSFERSHHNSKENSRSSSVSSRNSSSRDNKFCFYHFKFKDDAKFCNIGCLWNNRSPSCKQKDICVFHARYHNRARRCLEGCKFFKSASVQKNQ